MSTVRIPLRGSHEGEVLEVTPDQLPDDAQDLVSILKEHKPPIIIWLQVALLYYRMGKVESFVKVLEIFDAPGSASTSSFGSAAFNEIYRMSLKESEKLEWASGVASLAGHYMNEARKATSKEKIAEHETHATRLINKMTSALPAVPLTFLASGLSLVVKKDWEKAKQALTSVLQQVPDCKIARVGLAICHYNLKNPADALQALSGALMSRYATLFKTIPHIDINTATLETCRGVWAAIRPAMATLYNNDILESRAALLALKRQNEVCPTDDSLAYLGVLEINSHNRLSTDKATRAEANRSYAVGMKLLQHANKENRNNPVALNHLANHFFVSVPHEQRSYDQILNLTKSALTYATDNQTRAESYYQMGRVHHAQSDFTNALSSYQQSLKQVPTFIMPLFGIAQIFIHQKNYDSAIDNLKKVLNAYPDNFESLRMLTWLCHEKQRHEEAQGFAKKLHKLKPDDPQILLEIAQAMERSDLNTALDAYTRAAALFHKTEGSVSSELWNNIGVLRHRKGDNAGAMTAFVRAILVNLKSTIPVEYTDFVHAAVNATIPSIEVFSALEKNPDDLYQPKNVTTIFNLAKVFEDQRLDTKAEDIYVAILSYYPTYLDCYIRLGEMERSRGNIRLATSLFKEIMMEDENHVGAWSEVGTNQLLAGEVLPAQKSFERLGERDSYGVIQLSNVYLQSMATNPQKRAQFAGYVKKLCTRVIRKEPTNVYAANALGIMLAQTGKLAEARDFFTQVGLGNEQIVDVKINLANVYFEQGQYNLAAPLYEAASKLCDLQTKEHVLPMLAKTFLHQNKIEEARKVCLQLTHLFPQRQEFWFNLALVLKEQGTKLLNNDKTTSAQLLKTAVPNFEVAAPIFKHIAEVAPEKAKRTWGSSKCIKLASLCAANLDAAKEKAVEVSKREQAAAEAAERRRKIQQELMLQQQREEQDRIAQEEQQKLEEAQQEQAWRAELKRKQDEYRMRQEEEERQRLQAVQDSLDGKGRKKKKASRKKKKKDSDIYSDEDEVEASERRILTEDYEPEVKKTSEELAAEKSQRKLARLEEIRRRRAGEEAENQSDEGSSASSTKKKKKRGRLTKERKRKRDSDASDSDNEKQPEGDDLPSSPKKAKSEESGDELNAEGELGLDGEPGNLEAGLADPSAMDIDTGLALMPESDILEPF